VPLFPFTLPPSSLVSHLAITWSASYPVLCISVQFVKTYGYTTVSQSGWLGLLSSNPSSTLPFIPVAQLLCLIFCSLAHPFFHHPHSISFECPQLTFFVMAQVDQLNGLVHVEIFLDDLLLYNRATGGLVGWVTQVPQGDEHFPLPRMPRLDTMTDWCYARPLLWLLRLITVRLLSIINLGDVLLGFFVYKYQPNAK